MSTRDDDRHTRLGLLLRAGLHNGLAGCFALALGAALVAGSPRAEPLQPTAESVPAPAGPSAERAPVSPTLREIPIAAQPTERPAALSPPEPIEGYVVAGATWDRGSSADGMVVEIRSRRDGAWSGWEQLEVDEEHGPDPGTPEARRARPGTDPVVLGAVEAVQTRVTGRDVPAGLRLALVNATPVPADEPTGPAAISDASDGNTGVAAATAGVTARPAIFTRRQWGADERLRSGSPSYFEVHAGFVHHTVNSNSYTRSQVPSILRGIYAYHTRGRGWSDIGYNFLVDRFGRIWEGRYGGVDRPVVGAHTLGYNSYSFAMSAIGNFETVRPSAAMLDAYGRLMAWKLSLHGVLPKSTRVVGDRRFQAISGHRDAGSTACPGHYLYARLGTIRDKAEADQASYAGRDVPHNLIGGAAADLLVRSPSTGAISVLPGEGGPSLRPRRTSLVLRGRDLVAASADLTGDGRPDLLARDATSNRTQLFPGRAGGGFGAAVASTADFARADQLTAAGDFDGDGRDDVVSRDAASGYLYLHPGDGRAGFGAARLLLRGMGGLRWVVGAGTVDGDQHPDLIGMGPSGAVRLIAGDGNGGIESARRVIAADWRGLDLVAGGVNLGLNRRTDLVARERATGTVRLYALGPAGRVIGRTGAWTGLHVLDRLSAVPDLTGDGNADLIARRRNGRVLVVHGNAARWFGRATTTGQRRADANLLVAAGDLDRDGRGDALVRSGSNGGLRLYRGTGSGRLSPSTTWSGWGRMASVSGPGDVTGDGLPDIMAQDADRRMWIYPGDGRGGFRSRYGAMSGMIRSDLVVPAGRWNDDGAPDLIVRSAATGDLYLYPGNGPGGLTAAVRIGRGYDGYDRMMGLGDVNGDGHPDLVARRAGSRDLWLLPGTRTGLGSRQYLARPARVAAYDLIS
jgi:hypothetical protein